MGNSYGGYGNDFGYGGYEYGSGFDSITGSDAEMLWGVLGAVLGVVLVFALILLAVAVVVYVFQSIALYSIAKRRMIKNPWLAWLPIGSEWILGSISDQYQYVAKGKIRNRRKILLGLSIATMTLSAFYEIINTLEMFQILGDGLSVGAGVLAVVMLFVALGMLGVSIALTVFYYIALYDLYHSCDPSNGVLYLLLSIFLGITPFIMFACRKLDRGMPPRKEEAPALPQETAEVVAESVAEPVAAEEPVGEEPPVTPEETEPAQTPAEETQPEE